MKISKSKQELARIISENGGWLCADFAAQQDDGEVWFSSVKPEWNTGRGCFSMWYESHFTVGTLIHNRHQCILSRAEYFHLYPAPDADGWIEWRSECYGAMPCDEDAEVDIKVGDNIYFRYVAKCWKHWGSVTAYRLHKPEQAKHEFCESVMRSIHEPEAKPSIEQLMQAYADRARSLQLANEHLATCTKQANEAMEALSIACKAAWFNISPITEKQEPELVIAKFTGKFHSAKHGDRPESVDMICDGCGRRFGTHVGFDCRP